METYAGQDTSFQLAHHILGNAREMPCGDFCRILRQYTNIRDAEAKTDVNLVDDLVPTTGRVRIFLSWSSTPCARTTWAPTTPRWTSLPTWMHSRATVLPLRNVFTQYAGTTLSEPAIWSGAMLLHAHYMQPFSRVNGLEKLAQRGRLPDGRQLRHRAEPDPLAVRQSDQARYRQATVEPVRSVLHTWTTGQGPGCSHRPKPSRVCFTRSP